MHFESLTFNLQGYLLLIRCCTIYWVLHSEVKNAADP